MVRRAIWALLLAQAVLLAITFPTAVGTRPWHHVASLVAVVAGAGLVRAQWNDRRFLGIGVLATTVLATVSGFVLLYWKEGIRAAGFQDWGVFWHVAWSWAAAAFFWQHTWVNRVALAHFMRRSMERVLPAAVHLGLYTAAAAAWAFTAGRGRTLFNNESYIPIGLWMWAVTATLAYLAWWALRRRSVRVHKRVRGGVDLALVPVAAAAVVSGIPLLFFDTWLDARGLQYASKFWHVAPSILFSVLVYIHSVQLWSTLRRHWQVLGAGAARSA